MTDTSLQVQSRLDSSIHTIVPGLTMQWLKNGKIAAFTLTSPTHQVIEAYFQANYSLMDEADQHPDELMITLHDLSDKNMALTPLLKSRLDNIADRIRHGEVQHRSAVILSKSPLALVFSFFGNTFSRMAKNTIQKFFTDRQEAIRWLEQFID